MAIDSLNPIGAYLQNLSSSNIRGLEAMNERMQRNLELQADMARLFAVQNFQREQQAQAQQNALRAAEMERLFRSGENEADRAQRERLNTSDNAAAAERLKAQLDDYDRRSESTEKRQIRLALLQEYGSVPSEGETPEAFVQRARKERREQAASSFLSTRTHVDHAAGQLEDALRMAESDRRRTIELLARDRAAAALKIPLGELDPTGNVDHKTRISEEAQKVAETTAYRPEFQAQIDRWRREVANAQLLQNEALESLRASGADFGAILGGLNKPAPAEGTNLSTNPLRSPYDLTAPPKLGEAKLRTESGQSEEAKVMEAAVTGGAQKFSGVLPIAAQAAKETFGGLLNAADLFIARPLSQAGHNLKTAAFGGDFKTTGEMYTPEEKAQIERLFAPAMPGMPGPIRPQDAGNYQEIFTGRSLPQIQAPNPVPVQPVYPAMNSLINPHDARTMEAIRFMQSNPPPAQSVPVYRAPF